MKHLYNKTLYNSIPQQNVDLNRLLHIQFLYLAGTATFVEIKAPNVYGARHAFETLSNLITGSKE